MPSARRINSSCLVATTSVLHTRGCSFHRVGVRRPMCELVWRLGSPRIVSFHFRTHATARTYCRQHPSLLSACPHASMPKTPIARRNRGVRDPWSGFVLSEMAAARPFLCVFLPIGVASTSLTVSVRHRSIPVDVELQRRCSSEHIRIPLWARRPGMRCRACVHGPSVPNTLSEVSCASGSGLRNRPLDTLIRGYTTTTVGQNAL